MYISCQAFTGYKYSITENWQKVVNDRFVMTEFKDGFFRLIKKIIGGSSVALAIVYTLGHIIIAMTCNRLITGADWGLASIDAIIEPCINGVWFYCVHEIWRKLTRNNGLTAFEKK